MQAGEKPYVVESLRREQANAVQMYLQYKGYHWNVAGPMFHDLHVLFDEHAKALLEMIDPLAERLRILGFPADYNLEILRRLSNLSVETKIPETPKEMLGRLVVAHRMILGGLKSGVDAAERQNDPGTADLFIRCILAHEKMEWFLRELLESRTALLEGPSLGAIVASAAHGVVSTPT